MERIESFAADERAARVLLTIASEPGDRMTGRLLGTVGAVEAVRLAGTVTPFAGEHQAAGEVWRDRLAPRLNVESAQRALAETERLGAEFLIPGDPGWPAGVGDLGDRGPIGLWALGGDASLLTAPPARNVTVVGSRAASRYGTEATEVIAQGLAEDGYRIVSGGSYGIDITAHRIAASARGGATLIVLPSGLDRIYPVGNEELIRRAAQSGLMVSELPPGTPPTKWRLEQRGRLLASLSGTTIVVEAGPRSGALGVARAAFGLGRAVGAVPGSVLTASSAGPHLLLREGIAQLVTSEWDVEQLAQDWATGIERDRRLAATEEIDTAIQGRAPGSRRLSAIQGR
ncbi:DNA processing Smf-family protein [Propionibacterium freudenreichii]|uniref:DNA-processing protein DprA n=1 Tax=Propionibacterium freudenreichii TaxID=1744 RepID=UPI000BC2C5B9|nr:DNA-processing protein DprA [Propionibacterium freudenreichii]SBN59716.1 DNA processing Smf-family protein [Propionibacterium freudenreichii]SBN95173.1 DNA processing Smf-family protein [Propionibacterium freudenreichii]SCC96759.1 DNA processing Smf-family protein [Propionibacterium freudenreichii]SCQ48156.1 DNA processing Smf-family protein [Propionibacterium freudenreichii]SCQ52455.1 DNA processing Smf-family protein [Propionibacterium freudenreichii]